MKTRLKGRWSFPWFFVFLFVAFCSACGDKLELEGPTSMQRFTVNSDSVGDAFDVQLFRQDALISIPTVPAIILLDGGWYYDDVVQAANARFAPQDHRGFSIVGLGYSGDADSKRFRDYTVPADPEYGSGNGGGAAFLDFLAHELLPLLANEYFIDTSRVVIAGHSLGGYFSTYALLHPEQNPFDGHIAVSPSLWWNERSIFEAEAAYAPTASDMPSKVFFSAGLHEPPSMTILCQEMEARMRERGISGLQIGSAYYERASHSQTPVEGFLDGMAFYLDLQ